MFLQADHNKSLGMLLVEPGQRRRSEALSLYTSSQPMPGDECTPSANDFIKPARPSSLAAI